MKSKFFVLIAAFVLCGCSHSNLRFQKGRVLDVTMDPNKTTLPSASMHLEPAMSYERGVTSMGGSYGSSCPTCG